MEEEVMNYERMQEAPSSELADHQVVPSVADYQSTAPVTSQPAVLTISGDGAQQPAVLAVHTSATLSKPAAVTTPKDGEKSAVVNVMTSQEMSKRRTTSYEAIKAADEIDSSAAVTSKLEEFACPVGDRYKKHDTALERVRGKTRWLIDHIFFRAFTIVLIIIDLAIVITAVVKSETAADPLDPFLLKELDRLDYVALAFSSFFIVEVMLRIFAQTPKVFFRQILEIVDAVVVLVSFIVVVVDLAVDQNAVSFVNDNFDSHIDYSKFLQSPLHFFLNYRQVCWFHSTFQQHQLCSRMAATSPFYFIFIFTISWIVSAFRLVRLIRFGMLLRVMVTQRLHLLRATRLLVSENKRRFQRDGFDLDLCYITDRMIAMSFPSKGLMSVYRNPIEEVSRFFNTKYPNKYRIYNCCSERDYDAAKYFNNAVQRIMIDDHNVPSLKQMLDFANDVQRWMNANKDNVIAIHCKGGKGRTGTMVSVWLLHSEVFSKADDALDYFGSRRTDLSVDSKFQGVETPSQSRYVNYYEKMLTDYGGKIPEEKDLRPVKVSVSGLRGVGDGDGRDLSIQFCVNGSLVYEAKFGTNTNCTTVFERETATIGVTLINAPVLRGDVKVRFEATSNIPCAYDDCPWFFWFNSSFIEDNQLSLGREELDNPHQKRTWKLYKEDFRVTLEFDSDL